MKKFLPFLMILSLTLLIFLTLRPVPTVTEEACLRDQGTVQRIFAAGEKDIMIQLEEYDKTYYINRGLEKGLSIASMETKLLHQQVTIQYPDYWTLLDPSSQTRHIAKLTFGQEVIFTEL